MITTGQANIWRRDVKTATLQAHYGLIPMSIIPAFSRWRKMKDQVLQATFTAKINGYEYSRLKR